MSSEASKNDNFLASPTTNRRSRLEIQKSILLEACIIRQRKEWAAAAKLRQLAVNDYVELIVDHDDPGGLTIQKLASPYDGASPEFMMVKV